ncbi:phytanoyl-CoA dioxygenase family protein [Algisphaera agarilytica]|uniref:Uncharacterized protein n=1 Tax=Algisphaera agarilytica TaxID=1385975 RepID=A0A7X0H7L5_9BACT|nr:phytanoyl-CoA dioxygenase family protein [Algisphaera agarilytica]MBB6430775.1 hypothetical protein [Algisphaera agarilytica]
MPTTTEPAYEQLMASRDLSFAPSDPSQAQTLSPAQVEQYNRDGYLMPFSIYNELEAQANRAYFDYLLAAMRVHNDGRDTYAINGYHTRCEGIYDMATHPAILDIVQDLIGPNIVAWGTHFFCKVPHDPKAVPWHQDASYWPFEKSRTVTVWLAIDDADEENAAMKVIPRTHTLGKLEWQDTAGPAVLNQEIQDIEQYGDPVSINLKAGQIELHADMIAHGSTPNPSARRRCGLTIRYCAPDTFNFHPTWRDNAILCRGEDTTGVGQWNYQPRPAGNDLSIANKPKAIGDN